MAWNPTINPVQRWAALQMIFQMNVVKNIVLTTPKKCSKGFVSEFLTTPKSKSFPSILQLPMLSAELCRFTGPIFIEVLHLLKTKIIQKMLETILWLLKCCKNKNSYDVKIYFHSIKIILYLIKHIFIISPLFSWYENIFSFNQNKFVFNKVYSHHITFFFPWYQNIFSFSQNKFVFSTKYFYHIYFFHSSKIYLNYTNFSLNTFLMSISGLRFVFTKVRILLSVCKLNNSTRMWILINSFMIEVPII